MARRKEDKPLEKVTLNLFQGDMAKIRELHGDQKGARVIRVLVSAYLAKVNAKVEQVQPVGSLEISLGDINE